MVEVPEPWTPAQATERIRAIARDAHFALALKKGHAKDRLEERNLIMGDLLYLLRNGFVYEHPEPATKGYWKYSIQGTTPNSNDREARAVVIPDWQRKQIKLVVTVMWADERIVRGS